MARDYDIIYKTEPPERAEREVTDKAAKDCSPGRVRTFSPYLRSSAIADYPFQVRSTEFLKGLSRTGITRYGPSTTENTDLSIERSERFTF